MEYCDILRIALPGDDLGRARREYAVSNLPPLVYGRAGSPKPTSPLKPWNCLPYNSEEVGYKTGSGNVMSFLIHQFPMFRQNVPLLTEYEQVKLCGNCKGSSGGCPGFAPRFDKIKPRLEKILVITISIDMIWSIMYATPQDGWAGRRVLKQLVYADRITEHYCKRIMLSLKNDLGYYVMGAGNCAGCIPKRCTVIKGQRCAKPKKRTYSMEAVGIDCDALHEEFYGECLPWYYKGTNKMPCYMTRYIGIVYDGYPQDVVNDVIEVCHSDKSYTMDDVPDVREATVSLQEIPAGCHKGDFQYVYNDPGFGQV